MVLGVVLVSLAIDSIFSSMLTGNEKRDDNFPVFFLFWFCCDEGQTTTIKLRVLINDGSFIFAEAERTCV